MTDKIGLFSYNTSSKGVKAIKEALDDLHVSAARLGNSSPAIVKIRTGSGAFAGKRVIAHWGNTEALSARRDVFQLNNVNKTTYINKRAFFEWGAGASFSGYLVKPLFSHEQAVNYVNAHPSIEDSPVLVERRILDGHSGEGISLIRHVNQIDPSARLWTVYKKKAEEWRIHFFKGADNKLHLYCQKKLLKNGIPAAQTAESRFKVRNFVNGWVYSPNRLNAPTKVIVAAVNIAGYSNLDFGAVDIIFNAGSAKAFILEVNTAPGAVGSTAKWYADRFSDSLRLSGNAALANLGEMPVRLSGMDEDSATVAVHLAVAN